MNAGLCSFRLDQIGNWHLVERDGQYRIRTYLYGLQEERFDEYCRIFGADPAAYYDTEKITRLYESVMAAEDVYINSTEKEKEANAVSVRAMEAVMDYIGILLGLIGVSNTLSAVSWREMLPYMPWRKILSSIFPITAAVAMSYLISTGKITRDTIIETVREENV